ncbi:hypothetical protein OBA40_02085 [Alphaproteobacteria bacterium]|nr:hypothetical protein [Alphaproteobacteria bacterium]
MNTKIIFDRFVSNVIVYASYILMILLWSYFFYNFGSDINLLLFYFPFGIIILAFLFFGNRIIIGLLLSYFSLFFVLKNYNLHLPFNNFFVMSASQLICVPLTLFVLSKFNITLGVGKNYRLDKTNIYHVLLIIFLSTIVLGALMTPTYILYEDQVNFFKFIIGHFLGGAVLIISMKLLVNLPTLFKNLIKST